MDLTGTVFFLAGSVLRRFADRDAVFLRFLTKATLFAYLVPYIYIVLYLTKWIRMDAGIDSFSLFHITPMLLTVYEVLGCLWLGIFLVLLTERLYRRYQWARLCRGNIPEEDREIAGIFSEICTELGIREGRVALSRNDSVRVPCITYYHGYVVILPLVRYTPQEARVIFYHELCHYLNKDLSLKTVGCIAALLHAFNPAVHILMRQMDLLCERCCDRAACERGSGRFTGKEYFKIIMRSLVSDHKTDKYQLFALADDMTDYERRVEYMLGYHKNGGLRRGTALALAVCFVAGSSMTALAAGDGMTGVYAGLTDESSARTTDVTYEDGAINVAEADDPVLEEHSRQYDLDPEKVTVMEEEIVPYSKIKQIHWKVPAGETVVSTEFWQSPGDIVTIVVEPDRDDIEYEMGIQDPTALMRYVEGTGRLTHDFLIDRTGLHAFYITNRSETEPLVMDAYIIRD